MAGGVEPGDLQGPFQPKPPYDSMIPFRDGLLARELVILLNIFPQELASFATGPRQNNSVFYEIRAYDIKPSRMKEFVEMVGKHFHLRTAHSELVGLWSAELGAMNKVVHVWKYGTVGIPWRCSARCAPRPLGQKARRVLVWWSPCKKVS